MSSHLTYFSNPQMVLGSLFSLKLVWTMRDTWTFPLRVGLGLFLLLQSLKLKQSLPFSWESSQSPRRERHVLKKYFKKRHT